MGSGFGILFGIRMPVWALCLDREATKVRFLASAGSLPLCWRKLNYANGLRVPALRAYESVMIHGGHFCAPETFFCPLNRRGERRITRSASPHIPASRSEPFIDYWSRERERDPSASSRSRITGARMAHPCALLQIQFQIRS